MTNGNGIEWDDAVNVLWTGCRAYLPPQPYGFDETVARLAGLSGQDPSVLCAHDPKTSVEFRGTFHGRAFSLYDYYGDRRIHIGGLRYLDVAGLIAALVGALARGDEEPSRPRQATRVPEPGGRI